MDSIELIDNVDENMISKYIKPIINIALPTNRVILFKYNGVIYMVGQVDTEEKNGYDSYLISYEDKGGMKAVSTFYDRGYFQYESENNSYIYRPGSATINDKRTGIGGQLVFYENDERKVYGYNQWNNNKELLSKYIVSEYQDPSIVIDYLKSRRVNTYEFTINTRFITAVKGYSLYPENNRYYEYREKNNGKYKVVSSKSYTEAYMKSMVEKEGFNSSIPDDIISLYKGNLDEVKNIQNITDVYIKSTRL